MFSSLVLMTNEWMRLQILFLKPTNPKIQKIRKKFIPGRHSTIQNFSIWSEIRSSVLEIRSSVPFTVSNFKKPFQDFRVQDCSFRNQKKWSHAKSNQNLSQISCEFQSKSKPYPLPFWSAMPVKYHLKFLLHVKDYSKNSCSSRSFRKFL